MIESLDLNLSTRPFKNNTLLWTGYSVGFALLVVFAIWNVTSYTEYGRRLAETRADLMGIDDQIADLERREVQADQQLKQTEYDVGVLTSQAEGANGVIEWKAFSWTGLFNKMATVQPWNVYLASVRPTFRGRAAGDTRRTSLDGEDEDEGVVIVVEGFAKSLEALLDFERALFNDRHFDRPEPKRHQPTDSGEIVFEMEFTYYADGMPASVEDAKPDTAVTAADPEADDSVDDGQPVVEPAVETKNDEAASTEPGDEEDSAQDAGEAPNAVPGDDSNATPDSGGER